MTCKDSQYAVRSGERELEPYLSETIVEWRGLTAETITIEVEIVSSEGEGARVAWARYGLALFPFTTGSFDRSATFHIYPGDLFVRIEVRTISLNVKIRTRTIAGRKPNAPLNRK